MENFSVQFPPALPPYDLVRDGWTVMAAAMRAKVAGAGPGADYLALHDEAGFEKMQATRDRVDAIVADPATADALKPWYSVYCKRPCFADAYLQAFNRPNVTLVQTGRVGVERITRTGAVANGVEYPLDCLIFDTASSYAKRSGGLTIAGVDGHTLDAKWGEGASTLHGMHTRDFPNLFVISQVQAGLSPNFPHMIGEQAAHIADLVDCSAARLASRRSSRPRRRKATGSRRSSRARRRGGASSISARPLLQHEGRASECVARGGTFAAGPVAFARLLREWRERGDLAGLEANGNHARGTAVSGEIA